MNDDLSYGGRTLGKQDYLSLSKEEYRKVLRFQKGCAICHRFMTGEILNNPSAPNVDHWKTGPGLVRGILCRVCNLKLSEVEKMRRQATKEEILYFLNPPCYQLGIYRKYIGGEA